MKKLISIVGTALVVLAAAITITVSAKGADFRLTWTDTNAPAYQVGGYNLYMATGTNAFVNVASASTNTLAVVVTNLTPNVYKFYLTATNIWGESAPSSTIQTPPGLPSAQGLQLIINLK